MRRTAMVLLILCVSAAAFGQAIIPLPEASPAATVSQTIGVTDVTVSYHRPAMNKRKIWGGQVPYGEVWRAGANENTTISFSTPVKIEGQPLAAGTYGLDMIPTTSTWTVIFSKFANGWGSYNYDPAEDALRVTVTPQATSDSEERLVYTFDDVANDSAILALRWEKLRIPVKIAVDLPSTVQASIDSSLRGGKHWNPDAWAAAARWELRNGNVEKASQYADISLEMGTTYGGLVTKANVLAKQGDTKGATAMRDRAKAMANEAQLIFFTINPMKPLEAIAYLTGYLAAHPNTPEAWRINGLLGQYYAEAGDQAKAHDAFAKALAQSRSQADRMEVFDYINGVAATGKYE